MNNRANNVKEGSGKLCKYCLIYGNPNSPRGVTTVKDILRTDEELFDHIEMVHCIPIMRDGETHGHAIDRVKAKNPKYGTKDCTCPDCLLKRKGKELFEKMMRDL